MKIMNRDKLQNVKIGWKHMDQKGKYVLMKRPMAECQTIEIEKKKKYSYAQIVQLAVEAMLNDENKELLENCCTKLGLFDNTIFEDFVDDKGNVIDFWKFASLRLKSSNRQLKLYIMTNTISKEKVKASESEPVIKKSKVDEFQSLDTKVITKSPLSDCCTNTLHNLPTKITEKNQNNDDNYLRFDSDRLDWTKLFQIHKISIKIINLNDITVLSKELGCGAFGKVNEGIWLNTSVAIKKIKLKEDPKYILREVSILDRIRHQNITSLMAVTYDPCNFYLIMENFQSKTLRNVLFDPFIKTKYELNEHKKRNICQQICTAISFLHDSSPSVVHKDIKPENILVNEFCLVKLCDFGLSRCDDVHKDLCTTAGAQPRGTILYMAPEILLENQTATVKSDIWSLACVIKEIFCEKTIWNFTSQELVLGLAERLKKIMQTQAKPDISDIPKIFKKVIASCFDYTPARRPKASTLLDVMNWDSDEDE